VVALVAVLFPVLRAVPPLHTLKPVAQ
jgi:hypothetical protein